MSVFQFEDADLVEGGHLSDVDDPDSPFRDAGLVRRSTPPADDDEYVVDVVSYVDEGLEDDGEVVTDISATPLDGSGSDGVHTVAHRTLSLEDFDRLAVIGRGAYGKVYLVKKRLTGKCYAMKVLKKASVTLHAKATEHAKTEREILEEVRHPFIVRLFGAWQTNDKLHLILTYASGGELFSYLTKERMFPEATAAFYLAEILLALEHLHEIGIIYRDLKPENILLGGDGHVLLTDFGLSKVAVESDTICGSAEYMAPEIVAEQKYDKSVDIWTVGILLYDLTTGSPPFVGPNKKKTMEKILKQKLSLPNYLSSFAKDLLTKLLRKTPGQRLAAGKPDLADIRAHRFFRNVDWPRVAAKEAEPPIRPHSGHPEDVTNFDESFVSQPLDSPHESPHSGFFSKSLFKGFSYTHPHILNPHLSP
ncbi:kinase-like domain-containing protein [Hyaloraphidium curvatum]|nr:kinase-like domain-containing protein [Hyaloraphidium curvatum]